jgi:hypothetical protein
MAALFSAHVPKVAGGLGGTASVMGAVELDLPWLEPERERLFCHSSTAVNLQSILLSVAAMEAKAAV